MKTTLKKVLSMALALVLLVGVLPMAALAETPVEDPGYKHRNGIITSTFKSNLAGGTKHGYVCDRGENCTNKYEHVEKSQLHYDDNCDGVCDHPLCDATSFTGAGHNLTDVAAKSASCTEAGYSAHQACTKCGTTVGKTDYPAGHALTDVAAKAATCTEAGYSAHKACSNCSYTDGKTDYPACHALTDVAAKAATCTEAGYSAHKACSNCSYTENKTDYPALNHDFTGIFKSCTRCDARESDAQVIVNFYVDGAYAETKTSNTAADIQTLIGLCTKDDTVAMYYDYAIANNANAALTTEVKLGQTANIYLKTKATTSYIVYYNANVDASKDNRPIDTFVSGATMGDALDKLSTMTITRPGLYPTWFKLAGWYMDRACTTPVNRYAPITEDTVVYAKWERKYNYEVTLKLYTNGNTNTVVKVVDAFAYIQDDGILSNSEVTAIAKEYIKSNNDAPITAYGPFKSGTEWDNYCKYPNRLSTQNQYIAEDDPATVLHVMVHNAKIYNSTSSTGKKADSTNPKTGDMIMVPAAVMGTTVSALAVMFYLKKKRTV